MKETFEPIKTPFFSGPGYFSLLWICLVDCCLFDASLPPCCLATNWLYQRIYLPT